MDNQFQESDLPIGELRKLGLIQNGKPILSGEDIDALLGGHRTELITLHNLHADGINIRKIDAKLSLERMPNGHVTVQLHPIYRETKKHPLLIDIEADQLERGALTNVLKTYQAPDGKKRSWLIEYDPQTREFISSDPEKVQIPEQVNGETLTELQKEHYRDGSVIELSDGTLLQRRASSRSGVTSNRSALVFSLLLDGGISYLLLRGLGNITNSWTEQKDPYTEGYKKAMQEMHERQQGAGKDTEDNQRKNQHSRSLGKWRFR